MSTRLHTLALCICVSLIHSSGISAETIPFQAGQCADRALTETDDFAGATGGHADRYTFAWGGGTLRFAMSSLVFDEVMVIAGPGGFEVVVNDSPTAQEEYIFNNAPAGNYVLLATTLPGGLGDYMVCILPLGAQPTPTNTPANSATPPIGPGECIEQRLDTGDRMFSDGTFFDEYLLDWPGGDLLIALERV